MNFQIHNHNLLALRESYPETADFLQLPEDIKYRFDNDEGVLAGINDVDGKQVLCVQKGDQIYQLDSLYDESGLLNVWFNGLGDDWDLGNKLFMYGLGRGIFVRQFLKSARSDCRIIVHEPSVRVFETALQNFDITDIISDKRVRLVLWPVYSDKEDIKLFYEELIDYKEVGSVKTSFYMNYPRIFDSDYSYFAEGLSAAKELASANRIVTERFGGYFARNVFANLPLMTSSLSFEDLVRQMPEDIPAIIVAAGPSLDKNINDIRAAKGKSIIISTDTALKPLALAGIEPDIFAVVDGKKDERYLSEESSRRVPMVCSPICGETFLKLHTGVKFFVDSFCDHIKTFMDSEGIMFEPLSTGGSVANSCFGLAEKLHCKRIILVGQDLAYTGDKTHSQVTVRGAWNTPVKDFEHVIMGVDINGDPIRTSSEFALYKQWYEDEIRLHPDLYVIDATEGGIRIEGTELMTLKDAINKLCTKEFDFESVLSKVGRLIPDEKQADFIDFVKDIPDQIRNLERLMKESLSDYTSMRRLVVTDSYKNSQFTKLYRDCMKNGEKIENSPVIEYVHNQLQGRSSEMLSSVNKIEQDEKSELLAVCDMGSKYLKDMLEALSEIKPYIEDMMAAVSRM